MKKDSNRISMKQKKYITLCVTALALSLTSVQAQEMVAGWDFSQYSGDGFNTLSNPPTLPFTETLNANYSDRDPNGIGLESVPFGTLHYDGLFGSTDVDPDGTTDDIWPSNGDLSSNTSVGRELFDPSNGAISLFEGAQENNFKLKFLSTTALSIVFVADTTSIATSFTDWSVSFAGLDLTAGDSSAANIDVSFSTDGVNYGAAQTFNLTGVDTAFSTGAIADVTQTAYFKFDFGGTDLGIDNVGITGTAVPEPSAFAALAGALALGFVAVRRRRIAA